MTSQRQIGSVLLLGCLLAGPSLAEIINVSITGGVSGSEDVQCFDTSLCLSNSATFSNGNTQLGYGMYALSGSGSTVLDFPAAGSAKQTADTTASGFAVDLMTDANYSGLANTLGTSSVSNTLTLTFHLTQRSTLDLTGSLNMQCFQFFLPGCFIEPRDETESIELKGSGFDFSQDGILYSNEPVSFSATLNPGDYTLVAFSGPFAESQVPMDAPFEISLNAEFTAIPEPSWAVTAPVLFLAVWHGISLRRRRRA